MLYNFDMKANCGKKELIENPRIHNPPNQSTANN
jgi:hypothetical protein